MARKSKIKIKQGRKSCGVRKSVNAEDFVNQIRFLASANRLKSKAMFTKKEKDEMLDQLQRGNASYSMMYEFSEAMNTEKNFEVVITMLNKKSKYNQCDQKLILEVAEAFIRDVGVKS